jgi:hypothetical protein
MSVVYVDAIRLEDLFELVDEGRPSCLNSENVEYLSDIVGVSLDGIDLGMCEAGLEIGAFGLKHDKLKRFLLFLVDFVFVDGIHNESFGCLDSFDSLDSAHEDVTDLFLHCIEILKDSIDLTL